ERPLRLNFAATPERLAALEADSAFQALAASKKRKDKKAAEAEIAAGRKQQQAILQALKPVAAGGVVKNREAFTETVKATLKRAGVRVPAALLGKLLMALSERDETADVCTDSKGNVEPDPALRDYENVPLKEDVAVYMAREVLPHVPDAWVDESKTKIGYEIGLNRYFYTYTAPRPLAEIEGELKQIEQEIADMLAEVTR
ncbi:MAG: SAM-dependent DNA methyltransferase, partial [Anaerosomatales bacterium]